MRLIWSRSLVKPRPAPSSVSASFLFFVGLLFSLFLISTAVDQVFADPIPPQPQGRVNDLAGILSSSTRAALEEKLAAHERETTNQVVVVTVNSLDGDTVEHVAIAFGEKWKIGQKGKDNGVVLLVAKNERKVRIETGYGLEPALPDSLGGTIIRNEIVPKFKSGDYDGGVSAGVEAILKSIKGEYMPQNVPGSSGGSSAAGIAFSLIFMIIVVIVIVSIIRGSGGIVLVGGSGTGARSSWSSSGFSWDSSSSDSFSGGGGSFGGGGASGSW